MIRAHQLVDAIQSGTLIHAVDAPHRADRLQHLRSRVVPRIQVAHKFDCTQMSRPENGQMLMDGFNYASDLLRAGMSPFPYDDCYIEIQTWGTPDARESPTPKALVMHWEDAIGVGYIFERHPSGNWCDLGLMARYDSGGQSIGYARGLSAAQAAHYDECHERGYPLCEEFLAMAGLMHAKSCTIADEPEPQRLNARRAAQGRPPVFGHSIVTIRPNQAVSHVTGDGTHASPRLHWRRGHIRRLPKGGETRVSPCLVGDISRGFVSHDYEVRA